MSSTTEPLRRAERPTWDPGPENGSDPDPDVPQRSPHRRRLVALAVVATCGVVAGALFWFVWLPGWRPDLRAGEHYGVDVTADSGAIAWRSVRDDGIDFAYVKATEGREFTDERFDRNWLDSAAVGLERGAYHAFTLCSPGEDQARHFLSVAPPDPAALPPAVDLEQVTGPCGPSSETVDRELRQFLSTVEAGWGRQVVVLATSDFERRFNVPAEPRRPKWQPHLLTRPDATGWVMWQASERCHVEGIAGPVDLDVSATGWLARAGTTQPEDRASRR